MDTRFPSPSSFNFAHPEDWPRWVKRFDRYRHATGLKDKPGAVQVSTFIYSMGNRAKDILTSMSLSEEDSEDYEKVIDSFERHFIKKRNVIYERARFNQRRQEQGETVDTFITALFKLAEHCHYEALHDEMIRDRIVVGLRDSTLAEKLQLDSDLTMEKSITKARQSESVKKQQHEIRNQFQEGAEEVASLRAKKKPFKKQSPPTQQSKPPELRRRESRRTMRPMRTDTQPQQEQMSSTRR